MKHTRMIADDRSVSPGGRMEGAGTLVSIVTPAYNEEANLPSLHRRLCEVLDGADCDWEWIVIDDHSQDGTFAVLTDLARRDDRVRAIRFSRNFGAHAAVACGLEQARGDCAAVIPADLQAPPEVIRDSLHKWRQGAQVVWAARSTRRGDSITTIGLANVYQWVVRRLIGSKGMPKSGADGVLVDRVVIDALSRCTESNVSILALIDWMGFSQDSVSYDRQPRVNGQSGWSLGKKLKLVVDTVTAFSYLPIRLMSFLGVLFAFCGITFAGFVVAGRLLGYVVAGTGYAAIMTVLLLGFGFLMTFMGVLGEYLWRTFDNVRGRSRFIIEKSVGGPSRDSLLSQPNNLAESIIRSGETSRRPQVHEPTLR